MCPWLTEVLIPLPGSAGGEPQPAFWVGLVASVRLMQHGTTAVDWSPTGLRHVLDVIPCSVRTGTVRCNYGLLGPWLLFFVWVHRRRGVRFAAQVLRQESS